MSVPLLPTNHDVVLTVFSSGASVGSISSILSVSDLIKQVQQEAKVAAASIIGSI